MLNKISDKLIIPSIILIVCLPQTVFAYIGPGIGLSAIGSFRQYSHRNSRRILRIFMVSNLETIGEKKSQEPD